MAEGTDTYLSIAVPRLPANGFEIIQQTASSSTDIMTLTAASSGTGDFIVCQNSTGTECFVINSAGRLTLTQTNSGTSALEGIGLTVTDSSTYSTGYGSALYLHVTQSGAKTGNANTSQFNAIALDLTISAAAPYITGAYFYFAQSGSPTLTTTPIYGIVIFMEEVGQASTMCALSLQKANTTVGSSIDAFIQMADQGSGVTTDAFYFSGTTNPTNFIHTQINSGFVTSGAVGGSQNLKLKCSMAGTTYYIPMNTA